MLFSKIIITYSDNIDRRETEGLLEFSKEFSQVKDLIILTKDIEGEESESKVKMIPLWKWFLDNE